MQSLGRPHDLRPPGSREENPRDGSRPQHSHSAVKATGRPATDPSGPTGRLATWVAQTTLDDVPPSVRDRAKHLVLDGIACALVGAQLPVSRIGVEGVTALDSAGDSPLIGWDGRATSATSAAMVNSSFIQGFELDDYHPLAPLHSNSIILPAMLAAAPRVGRVSGERFLLGAILGYETGPRVGQALGGLDMLSRGWHSGVVFGPIPRPLPRGNALWTGRRRVRGRLRDRRDPVLWAHVGDVRIDGQAHAARLRLAQRPDRRRARGIGLRGDQARCSSARTGDGWPSSVSATAPTPKRSTRARQPLGDREDRRQGVLGHGITARRDRRRARAPIERST